MNHYNPYCYNPYFQNQSFQNQPQAVSHTQQPAAYKKKNSGTHYMMGIAAGAAVAYLISNKKLQKGVAATGEKAWSAVRGEVEELKERLEDTQAELEYYRNLHKGE